MLSTTLSGFIHFCIAGMYVFCPPAPSSVFLSKLWSQYSPHTKIIDDNAGWVWKYFRVMILVDDDFGESHFRYAYDATEIQYILVSNSVFCVLFHELAFLPC